MQPAACSRALTLVELLVVLGIIGLIVSVSVPGLAGYARRMRAKTSLRQVVGLVSLARSQAVSSHEPHAVVVDPARREIRVVNMTTGESLEQVVRLPSSSEIAIEVGGSPSAQTRFVFRPTGSLEGRTVSLALTDQERRHTVTVTAATGAVSVE